MPSLPNAQWKLLVDWNRDGDFSDASEDITQYVIEWHWKLGNSNPYQEIGDEAEATFVLDNQTGYFSPERAGPYQGLMDRNTPVLVQSVYGGVTIDHFTGWVDTVQPTPGTVQPRRAVLNCSGIKQILEKTTVYLELMESVTADQVIDAILLQVGATPANLTGNWLLGVTNFSEMGEKTWLADPADFWTLQTGLQIFPYVADTWADGVTAMDALADVVAAERGRLFQGRNGKLIFWNRAYLQTNVTSLFSVIDTTFETMDYRYGENLANVIRITISPRTISAAGNELLWEAEDDIVVPRDGVDGKGKTIRASFKSTEDGTHISGRNILKPDRTRGTLAGTKLKYLDLAFEADARSAKMILKDQARTPSGTSRITVTTLQVRGQKLTTWKQQEFEAVDEDSLARRGRQEYVVNATLLDDEDFARQVINFELARRKDPRGEIFSMTVRNHSQALLNQMLNRTMGDRITVSETQTGHSSDYFIVGEEHTLIDGTANYTTTWYLETADNQHYWVLGETDFSELGETTFLGL